MLPPSLPLSYIPLKLPHAAFGGEEEDPRPPCGGGAPGSENDTWLLLLFTAFEAEFKPPSLRFKTPAPACKGPIASFVVDDAAKLLAAGCWLETRARVTVTAEEGFLSAGVVAVGGVLGVNGVKGVRAGVSDAPESKDPR